MTDKELTDAAAQAFGARHFCYDGMFGPEWVWEDVNGKAFDPLNDDGDALRLAVNLGLNIIQQRTFDGPEPVAAACGCCADDFRLTSTTYNGDRNAATRRAIVRAAAAMLKD